MVDHWGNCSRLPKKRALSGRRSALWRKVLRGSWEIPRSHCNKWIFHNDYCQNSTSDLKMQYKKEKGSKNSFFTSDLPRQQIATSRRWDRERRRWWRTPALWRQVKVSHTAETRPKFQWELQRARRTQLHNRSRLRYCCDNSVVASEAGCLPAEHILGLQLHQHSVWCSALFQRICWFFLWQLGSWKHRPLFLLHICLPSSALMKTHTHTHSFTITQTNEPAQISFLENKKVN